MTKSSISFVLFTFTVGAAAAAGCSAPDPGVEYLGPRHLDGTVGGSGSPITGGGAPGTTSDGGSGGGTVVTTDDSGATVTPTGDGGVTPTGDAGGGEGGATAAFLGEATPFAATPPAQTALQSHQGAGQAAQTPTLDCTGTCHKAGGAAAPFLFAGFVATAANGATGAAGVEVRAYNGTTGFSAYSDTNGYFWKLPPAAGATGPYNLGARTATTTHLMTAQQATIDCQSSTCHGGAAGPVHVP